MIEVAVPKLDAHAVAIKKEVRMITRPHVTVFAVVVCLFALAATPAWSQKPAPPPTDTGALGPWGINYVNPADDPRQAKK